MLGLILKISHDKILYIRKVRGQMDLKTYLKNRDIPQKEFAERIGVSEGTIANYLHWRRKPTLSIALKIEKVTKGKVTVEDLNDYWEFKEKYG